MRKELAIFEDFARQRKLKHSSRREAVLKAFLKTTCHVSSEDLFQIVRQENEQIGYTTVYRTLKLMVDCGLAEEVDFNDGVKRYERRLGREYHAHFICTRCGANFEAFDDHIRQLSLELARKSGFEPKKQRFEIFGLCQKCQ